MKRLIKKLRNNSKVIFDKGKFDHYCVYVVLPTGEKSPPLDVTYFSDLQNISTFYEGNKIYADFVKIYDRTNDQIDKNILKLIDELVLTYKTEHQQIIEKWFTVIYAGMIAEENKKFAILKKRIKRLGMHQVLIDEMKPLMAANFSKGKKWRDLDRIMKPKGF